MENINQQVPPVPNEPSIRAANNLSFFKTLAYGFVIVLIGVSIAIGGYLLGAKQNSPLSQISQNEQKLVDAKKRDLRIISDMMQSKVIAELINSDNGNYSRVNCDNIQLSSLCNDIKRLSGQKLTFYSSNNAYCGYVKLSSGSYGGYYCVDSIHSGKTDINPSGGNYCNGNAYTCPPVSSVVDSGSSSQNSTNSPNITIISPNGGEKWTVGETQTISWSANKIKNVIISLIQGSSRVYLVSPKTGVSASLGKFDWKPENSAFFVGRNDLKIIVSDATYCSYVDESTGIECVKDEIPHGDTSDSYFSIVSANLPLPTACEDKPEGLPVITSLSNYSGSVGAKIEIRGCNFSGFEGNINAWIENEQGIKGIFYGEEGSSSKTLKVTLKSPLCQKDNSYSGLPCDAWLTLNPGTYKIFTLPWGRKSNEVNFTIK